MRNIERRQILRKAISHIINCLKLSICTEKGTRLVQACVVIPLIVFICLICFALDETGNFKSSEISINRRAGNATVANDLYGLGVRIGIYAQATGMLLSAVCLNVGGSKIACSATMLGLLSSWTVLAIHKQLSACEAFIIISLINLTSEVGSVTAYLAADEVGIGTFMLAAANCWASIISFWFWATLYNQLPTFGTSNTVWIFVEVSVRGWFRIFMLVAATLQSVYIIFATFSIYKSTRKALKHILEYGITKEEIKEAHDELKSQARNSAVFVTIILVLSIASVEMIIKYNGLTPEGITTSPGQTIPLTIGLVILVDGIANAILYFPQRKWRKSRESLIRQE